MVMAALTGCASTKSYFVDRGRDAADIVTATVGVGVGAKAQVGPLHAGVLLQADHCGLRGGKYENWHPLGAAKGPSSYDIEVAVFGGNEFHPYREGKLADRGKYFSAMPFDDGPLQYFPILNYAETSQNKIAWYYYTELEVVVGLIGSVRLGFNVGELTDFALGWFGIDLFSDDIAMKTLRQESNEAAQATAPKVADPGR